MTTNYTILYDERVKSKSGDSPMDTTQGPSKKKKLSAKYRIVISGMLVILIMLGATLYFFLQYQKTQALLKNPTKATSEEINALISKVSNHYDLPTDDQPTLATVSDITKLAGQPFFAKAKNGDKVVIFAKAKIAILYRPALDKIINVGPVNTQADANNTTGQLVTSGTSSSASIKVALYNGTSTNGLTKK